MDIKNIKLIVILILWISAIVFFASTLTKKPVPQKTTIDHYVSKSNDLSDERKKCVEEKLEIEDQLRKKNAPVKKC